MARWALTASRFGALSVIVVPLLFGTNADASGFDCGKAAMPSDFVICSNPSLLDKNNLLASLWFKARQGMDAADKAELVKSQSAWLKSIATDCGLPERGRPSDDLIRKSEICVFGKVQSRIKIFEGMVSKQGTATQRLMLAAGFACGPVTASHERLICHYRDLSDLDEQLERAYLERQALLSPSGAKIFQRSERNWLHFVTIVCSTTADGNADQRWPEECLRSEYQRRLTQLGQVGQRVGPFIFNRIDDYHVEPVSDSTDQSGEHAGFYVLHVAYPQIDNPLSSQVKAWNGQEVRETATPTDCDQEDDHDVGYEIGYATHRLISVQWGDEVYCHHAAHDMYMVNTENSILSPSLRALTARDVFEPSNGWDEKLRNLFWDAIRLNWANMDGDRLTSAETDLENYVVRPDAWLFKKEGLEVSFGYYAISSIGLAPPPPITIPWAKLRPLLSHTAVVP